MLALPAMTLYAMEKQARSASEPGRRKDSARSVCVQSVREGSTMARNLICVCSMDSTIFPVRTSSVRFGLVRYPDISNADVDVNACARC